MIRALLLLLAILALVAIARRPREVTARPGWWRVDVRNAWADEPWGDV